jgi:hypothetical protein
LQGGAPVGRPAEIPAGYVGATEQVSWPRPPLFAPLTNHQQSGAEADRHDTDAILMSS